MAVAWVMFTVIGVSASAVVLSKGSAVVKKSGTDCLFGFDMKNTQDNNTPKTKRVPRLRRTERSLGSLLFGSAFDTCPNLNSLTG